MGTPAERLRARITADGPVTFAEFMAEALYGDGGYYRGERWPVGGGGDFVTGSTLSPLFGRATARLLSRLDRVLGTPAALFEAGYGDGGHLAAVAEAAGPGRRLLGWDRAARPLPGPVERLARLEELAPGAIDGLVFSYELFDALPVHRLVGRASAEPGELLVGLNANGGFAWQVGELSAADLADPLLAAGIELEVGQIVDLAPEWQPLYRELARRLGRGLLVTCDYGLPAARLYDPRVRRHGTLACYRAHRVHRDPFVAVGEQDLTAHVDFDVLRRAGEAEGLTTVALVRQANWLVACGLFADLAEAPLAVRHQALALLDLDGMGEETSVLVQARGCALDGLFDVPLLDARGRAGL